MSILTSEELKLKKEEARDREIRQNVKSHCTKIRDGIRKNGSTSGNRAIWELFQNAGDLAVNGNATIRITLNDSAFIFEHKGKSFTYDSLCSLVKQVSSQEKEDDDTVGQYGTGFLTTHKFGRKIIINGSMLISEDPIAYVDVDDFVINRERFDDIPHFIDDMTAQIKNVSNLLDAEQKPEAKEWTKLSYELNEERKYIAQTAIDEAIKLMPYVLTFNDNIGCCTILDETRSKNISFTKEDKVCTVEGLLCKRIVINEDDGYEKNFDCYYLELHNGDSRIILPLESETQVYDLGDVPRLFVHFPLIGPNYFGVNFLFHSHRFTPEESRDNIIVPKDNDATDNVAAANNQILDEMTQKLWGFLEANVCMWKDTIRMASINIKDDGYSEAKTENYYKELKEKWVKEFLKLKLIDANGNRYSMEDANHPLVLEPSLEYFLSEKKGNDYLSIIYPYANGAAIIPCKEELLGWSKIVADWNSALMGNFLSLAKIVEYVSNNQGEHLHDMLKFVVEATNSEELFEKYALLPNREGILKRKGELRDAKPIVPELYSLVKNLAPSICIKMVDESFADIISLTVYGRNNLRDELNAEVKKKEDECWSISEHSYYNGDFERYLIEFCSSFTTMGGDSKRNRLMPVICRFEGFTYCEKCIPAWQDDPSGFDLYRQAFLSLVENQMRKIESKDEDWVKCNYDDLIIFIDNARGDDYKNFCTQYAIYPNLNMVLHKPEDLKKKDSNVNEKLLEIYQTVIGEDLKDKCVSEDFETFYHKYSEDAYKYTAQSVAKEIQNKLSADGYKDTVLIDIIELTEIESLDGYQWRTLFKDIYDQRQSIRYNLGTDTERKAINTMLKLKNPALMERMAEVSERKDANDVLQALNETIANIEHDVYIKMLGEYVEKLVDEYMKGALTCWGITVTYQQGGQDFILQKEGYEDYHVEVKSRWEREQSVEMSSLQFQCAVENAERYALISVNMYHFDRTRAEENEIVPLAELYSNIKCRENIGFLEQDLRLRVDNAFKGGENDIRLEGTYKVRVPQRVFDVNPIDFNGLMEIIKSKFL